MTCLPALLLAGLLAALGPLETPQELPTGSVLQALNELDLPDRGRVDAALERLAGARGASLQAALGGFEAAGASGRAARAELLLRAGTAAEIDCAIDWLSVPDPRVRLRLAEFLGRPDLLDERAEQRALALAGLALEPSDPALREVALKSLGHIDAPSAAAALEGLLPRLPAASAASAVQALVELDSGRPALVRLVQTMALGESLVSTEAWPAALEAYGRALPILPGRGLDPAERAPLLALRRHPRPEICEAADRALDQALQRYLWLDQTTTLFEFLDALAADGLERAPLAYRVAALCLSVAGDGEAARRAAGELLAGARGLPPEAAGRWRFAGRFFEACAELCAGGGPLAEAGFDAAALALTGESEARPELRRRLGDSVRVESRRAVETLANRALCDFLAAGSLLRAGVAVEDPRIAVRLERVVQRALEAQWIDVNYDAEASAGGFDFLLDRELAPRRLLCFTERDARWPREQRLEWLSKLLSALAVRVPGELPGLGPRDSDPTRLLAGSPALGTARQAQLEKLRLADLDRIARRQSDPRERQNRQLWRAVERDALEALDRDKQRGYVVPAELRTPSLAALDLALDYRAVGRADLAVAALERLRADFQGLKGAASAGAAFEEWVSARVALALGSCLSDRGEPGDLERASGEFDGAHERMATMQRDLDQRLFDLGRGRMGPLMLEEVDPADRQRLTAQRDLVRRFQAEVRVAQAVHTNVRLGQPERARELFEEALGLEQNDFMRALLACYRARAGRTAEARFLLARLEPAPELYYNLACTHALLGEPGLALEYLRRELDPLRQGRGALERQKAWALADPDLSSLRADPRFQDLVAPAEAPKPAPPGQAEALAPSGG